VRITKNDHDDLILKNNPHPLRFVGLFFFLVSSAFVYGSLGGYSNYAEAPEYVIKLHFLGGAVGVFTGSWLILTKSAYVKISAATQTVGIIKSNLLGKKETLIPFYKIKEFIVSDKLDQDGDPIWKVDLELENADIIEFTRVWSNDKPLCEEAAKTANLILHKPLIALQNQT
jgi:hypothetical protein